MDVEMVVTVSDALRRAVAKRCYLRVLPMAVVPLCFGWVFLALCMVLAWQASPGESRWEALRNPFLQMLFGGVLLFSAFTFVVAYWFKMREARQATKKCGDVELWVHITDAGIEFKSPEASGLCAWRLVTRLDRFAEAWLLGYDEWLRWCESRTIVLPADALAPEVREFIEAKVREAGGKVK